MTGHKKVGGRVPGADTIFEFEKLAQLYFKCC